jgi:hypothetical protein
MNIRILSIIFTLLMSLGVEAQIDPPGLVSFSQCCQMKINSKMVIFSTDQKIGNN